MPCSYHTPTVLSPSDNSQSHLYITFASWCVFLCGLAQDCHWLLILESTRASGKSAAQWTSCFICVRPLSFFSPCVVFCAWFADDGYQVIVIWSPEIRHWDSHPIDNGSHECHLNQGWVPNIETSWNFRLSNVVASFERSAKDCRASCFNSCSSRYIKLQTACLTCLNCWNILKKIICPLRPEVDLMRLNEVCMLDLVDRVATTIYGKIHWGKW